MSKKWVTKEKDMLIARNVINEYATKQNSESLGLFELVVNQKEKRMDFRLSAWVVILAGRFKSLYGVNHGNFVTRQVISRCIIQDATLH